MIRFVTSFHTEAPYVPGFLESWKRHNPNVSLDIYYDGAWVEDMRLEGRKIWFCEQEHPDLFAFRTRWEHNAHAMGVVGKNDNGYVADYRLQGLRFAPKVFAYTDPMRPKCEWWCWIDADTEILKPFDDRLFSLTCPDDAILTWLDRPGWGHCESGFIGFRHNHPACDFILRNMRKMYTDDRMWGEAQWHDAWLLNRVVDMVPGWRHAIKSLATADMDQLHPWPETILGEYVEHKKGNRKNAGTLQGYLVAG